MTKQGYKQSEEHRRHSQLVNIGRKLTEEHKNSIRLFRKGKTASEETKRKMSVARTGKIRPPFTEEHRRNISLAHMGKSKGEKCNWWKGGITPLNVQIRTSHEYKLWRKSVFQRDNYTCVWCGDVRGGNLNADHIKPFALFPELRFAIDNGRTLCVPCHKTTDTYGRHKKQV